MKVSVNCISSYGTSASAGLNDVGRLVEKIGLQLGAVEEVTNLGERYRGILVAKVVSAEKHPNADKLSLCQLDDGGINKQVRRGKSGLIQVVCGAPNVRAGQLIAWIPPGVTVPSSLDEDPLVLEAREIRGQISNGMIASGKELSISEDHQGILVIDEPAKPGQPFAKIYGLDDYVIDIENKMFTHRPDCFGLLGIARELAGIYGKSFKSPEWYREDAALPNDGRKQVLKLAVKNEIPNLVPRFCAVALKDIKVGPSPVWLQSCLSRLGARPINNIVDITNWFMLATGQPLHAYDYDKLKTGTLGVRLSQKGEKLSLIGGKQVSLEAGGVVITDGNRPIGLGGIKGGADTEVDEKTKNIILECANFDMNLTRKTAMTYGIFTDAATRFTKNQSPRQNRAVLVKAVNDTLQQAGGRLASPFIDDKHFKETDITVKTSAAFINQRLGTSLSPVEAKTLLENVEFKVKPSGASLSIVVPFWRTDIEIPEDIVEEVGRLYGYNKLPAVLPRRDLAPGRQDDLLSFKSRLREVLSRAGANEVLTYSFVHSSLMEKAGQNPKDAYHIRNALSPDLQYYRLSLPPSLLEKVHPNIKAGFDEFALFEIGKGHVKGNLNEEKLPSELERIALVWAAKEPRAGAPYFQAKLLCDYLLKELGIVSPVYKPLGAKNSKTATYYEPSHSAAITVSGEKIGRLGEPTQQVRQAFKLPKNCAIFVLDIEKLLPMAKQVDYQPLNRYPELEQDFCLRSSTDLSYQSLTDFVVRELGKISKRHGYGFWWKPLDIYQRQGDKRHKQTTWRIALWHPERTLTTEETNKLLDKLAETAKKELKAERI